MLLWLGACPSLRRGKKGAECAAALLRLCEICAEQTSSINSEAAGSANIFIRVLLGKKYALPYKVVDALVFHFIRLSNTYKAKLGQSEKLPVLWHQSLLVFCQRQVRLVSCN